MEKWISRPEAAAILKISPQNLSEMATRGDGPVNRWTDGRKRQWLLSSVVEWSTTGIKNKGYRKRFCETCGKAFLTRRGRYCCNDCRDAAGNLGEKGKHGLPLVQVTAKCPSCEDTYQTVLEGWTGTGTARLFCPKCVYKRRWSGSMDRQALPVTLGVGR